MEVSLNELLVARLEWPASFFGLSLPSLTKVDFQSWSGSVYTHLDALTDKKEFVYFFLT